MPRVASKKLTNSAVSQGKFLARDFIQQEVKGNPWQGTSFSRKSGEIPGMGLHTAGSKGKSLAWDFPEQEVKGNPWLGTSFSRRAREIPSMGLHSAESQGKSVACDSIQQELKRNPWSEIPVCQWLSFFTAITSVNTESFLLQNLPLKFGPETSKKLSFYFSL